MNLLKHSPTLAWAVILIIRPPPHPPKGFQNCKAVETVRNSLSGCHWLRWRLQDSAHPISRWVPTKWHCKIQFPPTQPLFTKYSILNTGPQDASKSKLYHAISWTIFQVKTACSSAPSPPSLRPYHAATLFILDGRHGLPVYTTITGAALTRRNC